MSIAKIEREADIIIELMESLSVKKTKKKDEVSNNTLFLIFSSVFILILSFFFDFLVIEKVLAFIFCYIVFGF